MNVSWFRSRVDTRQGISVKVHPCSKNYQFCSHHIYLRRRRSSSSSDAERRKVRNDYENPKVNNLIGRLCYVVVAVCRLCRRGSGIVFKLSILVSNFIRPPPAGVIANPRDSEKMQLCSCARFPSVDVCWSGAQFNRVNHLEKGHFRLGR